MAADLDDRPRFPVAAGVLLGLGLGGFFDGIVLHQILQWHHLISHETSPTTVAGLELNTLWDGVFHVAAYAFTAAGLALLWHAARRPHQPWRTRDLVATLLIGFGTFNVVEGLVDHQLLGLHHVNETAPEDTWWAWDLGFLLWGASMLVGGLLLLRPGRRAEAHSASRPRSMA